MTKRSFALVLLSITIPLSMALPLPATQKCDQNASPRIIFGDGNANGAFTTATSRHRWHHHVEVALRAKLRHDADPGDPQNIFNSNGDGTYTFIARRVGGLVGNPAFPPPLDVTAPEWSIEWSVNSDKGCTKRCKTLSDYRWELFQDIDSSYKTEYVRVFGVDDFVNGINPASGVTCWDHNLGNEFTTDETDFKADCGANNAAVSYQNNLDSLTVAQNSWQPNLTILPDNIGQFNPEALGIYDFLLRASDAGFPWIPRAEIKIRVIAIDPERLPLFPPTQPSDCRKESNLVNYGGIFEDRFECIEFVLLDEFCYA